MRKLEILDERGPLGETRSEVGARLADFCRQEWMDHVHNGDPRAEAWRLRAERRLAEAREGYAEARWIGEVETLLRDAGSTAPDGLIPEQ